MSLPNLNNRSLPTVVEQPAMLQRRTNTFRPSEMRRTIAWDNASTVEISLPDSDCGDGWSRLDPSERSVLVLPVCTGRGKFEGLRKMDKKEQGLSASSSVGMLPRTVNNSLSTAISHHNGPNCLFKVDSKTESNQLGFKRPVRNSSLSFISPPSGLPVCDQRPLGSRASRPMSAYPGARLSPLLCDQATGLCASQLKGSSSVGTLVPERMGLNLEANRALFSIQEGSVSQEKVFEEQPAR